MLTFGLEHDRRPLTGPWRPKAVLATTARGGIGVGMIPIDGIGL